MAGATYTQPMPSGLPGERYGSFADKFVTPPGPHNPDTFTQCNPSAIPGMRYGSFARTPTPPPTPVVPAVIHGGGGGDRHHHHGPSPLEKLLEWYKDRGRKRPEPARGKPPKPAEKKPPEPAYVELELDVLLPRPKLSLSASVVVRHDTAAPEYEFDVRLARPSFALHHDVELDVPGAFAEYAAKVTLPFAGRGLLKRGLSAAWRRVKNDDAAVLGLLASMGEIDHDVAALLAMADE